MPVKIRLTRLGKKKQPSYRVVVMDSRKPRDGKYIEQIGRYDARENPSVIEIDNTRAVEWLQKGAQPTDRVRKLLEISGAWTEFKVARGDVLVVGDAPEPKSEKPDPAPVILDEIIEEAAAAADETVEEPAAADTEETEEA